MTPAEERQLRRSMAKDSARMQGTATEGARRSTGAAEFGSAAPRAESEPSVEPYAPPAPTSADEMGGAQDMGGPPIEYGPTGERVPGPQSFGGAAGMFSSEDANNLVRMVRHDRLARDMATQKVPTFGEVAANTRAAQAEAAAQPPAPSPEDQQAQAQQIAQSIQFLVDTRTGEFEPVMPGQAPPTPGPNEILMSPGQDPSQPNILAAGKRVTPADIARLGDPKRAPLQPTLKKGFKVPPEYAGIAQALGVGGETA